MLNNLFNASHETNSRILLYPDAEDNEFLITVSFYQAKRLHATEEKYLLL
jgi:hypothetical protein